MSAPPVALSNVSFTSGNFDRLIEGLQGYGVIGVSEGKIRAVDHTAETLIGLSRADLLDQPTSRLPQPLHAPIERALRTAKSVGPEDIRLSGDITDRLLRVTALPFQSGGGECDVVCVIWDRAGLENIRVTMQRLERLASIGTLSASMAHEVKNALVAVNTFVEDLLLRHQDSELAQIVGREIRRIDGVLSQMLLFAGPARPVFSPVRLHSILAHCLELLGAQFEEKKVRPTCRFQASEDWI